MQRWTPILLFAMTSTLLATVDGGAIYKTTCAGCHAKPAERVPDESALQQLSARHILRTLQSGSMSLIGLGLSQQQKIAVSEFVSGKELNNSESDWLRTASCSQSTHVTVFAAGWTGWSPDEQNTRFQPQPGLASADIPRLQLKWAFGFPGEAVAFAQPTVSGGRLFVGSASGDVYSLDAKTGCVLWTFPAEASVRTAISLGPASAFGPRLAFFGDFRANAYAVNADTGKLVWKAHLDTHPFSRITASPVWYNGRVYMGISSFEEGATIGRGYECCTFRGSVVALDSATGREIWQTYTISAPAQPTTKTKSGTQLYGPSGAAVWGAPTVDSQRGLLYVGTGDNYTTPSTEWSDSILALNLDSGTIAWARQMTAKDTYHALCKPNGSCPEGEGPDSDFGSSPVLVRAKNRDLIIAAQKSGIVYALDPDAKGKVVWQTRVAKGGVFGGVQWGPAADNQRLYAAVSDLQTKVTGLKMTADPKIGGGLTALSLTDGEALWNAAPPVCGDRPQCSPAQTAAVTAIPGVVFSGARDGVLRAYSVADGKVIWSADTVRTYQTVNGVEAHGGAIDGPGPAIAGGMLYVNSGYAWWGGHAGNVLLAFGLPDSRQ